ncbi:MAG: 23S rRNA (guanosine(2251)-2'-O)-methyltransferase RlmB [Erysipelotrichaceae bacterium]|nr:23S rRNA (guanosine(2251)-2'-O)-methyltransferase RlmB [Erysipelotrichaceae bacterium]
MSEIVFGKNSFVEALQNGRIIRAYLANNDNIAKKLQEKNIRYEIVSRSKLDSLTRSGNHQGYVAEVKEFKLSKVEDMIKSENGLIVMLDGLKDPHNLGAIIRTCECAGVDGVIYKKHNAVHLNDTVAKVACGAVEYVKVAEVNNLVNTIKDLKQKGYWVVGTDGSARDMYNKIDYNMNTVLIIGSEGEGMSRLVKEECDFMVKMPMFGHINSLNASVAAGIMIYNVLDKRGA